MCQRICIHSVPRSADEELYMNFVLIIWFISQSAIAVTSAQFERMEECKAALQSVQSEFSSETIKVGGGCYRSTAKS